MKTSIILLNNYSACCGAEIQRTTYLYGGMGGYIETIHICTKCLEELDKDGIIHTGKIRKPE